MRFDVKTGEQDLLEAIYDSNYVLFLVDWILQVSNLIVLSDLVLEEGGHLASLGVGGYIYSP